MGSPLHLTKSPGLIIAGLTLLSLGIIGFGTWKTLRSGSAKPDPSAIAVVEDVRREVSALGRVEPEGGV
jgi:multidrug efflux pump subunit AcrA (membrane-fusion protein)